MTEQLEPPVIHEYQLQFPGLGPAVGARYRHRITGTIVAVLQVEQRSHGWVTIRVHGERQTVTLGSFERTFEPLPPTHQETTR